MKLKKVETAAPEPVAPAAGGAVIAERFKLDPVEEPKTSHGGGVGAMIALVCSLVSIVMIGAVAALLYMNWDFIKDV